MRPVSLVSALADLRSGAASPARAVQQALGQIALHEDLLQALVPEPERASRLHAAAAASSQEEGLPLAGVLVGVKDIFHVDGLPTRAGSALPPEVLAGPQSAAVSALLAAGALVLGKTVTAEMAYCEPGPTRNPRSPEHTPGGSSSGSAAAVAAGYCPLALGTQTVGSVIRPAAFCGVVGFKPTYGRISSAGVIPFSPSVDTVGLFTADVPSVRLACAVLCSSWRVLQASTSEAGPVLGVPEGPYLEQASAEGLAAFAAVVRRLEQGGWRVRRVPVLSDIAAVNQRHRQLIAAEVALVHATWLACYGALYRPRTAAIIEEGQRAGAAELEAARRSRQMLRRALETAMDDSGVELWICPSAPGPAPHGLASTGDPVMNLPWTHAGMPAVSLPAGTTREGLPLGLQCVARSGHDECLLAWTAGLERALAPAADGHGS